jgi:methionyl aminopeptidase
LHQISAAVQEHAEANGFTVVEELIGHGVGAALHEDPEIPNFRQKTKGPRLLPGMTLAIEPMLNAGTNEVITLEDGWTVITADGKNSAHYENTVLITDGEPEILTI